MKPLNLTVSPKLLKVGMIVLTALIIFWFDYIYHSSLVGQASMLYDKNEIVFYNKVQVLNRDLSIQVISHFSELRQQEWTEIAKKKSVESKFAVPDGVVFVMLKFGEHSLILIFFDLGIVILDALAATGLRTIRYLKEIPHVKSVIINDFLPAATDAAMKNVTRNGVSLDRYRHIQCLDGSAMLF